LAVAIFLAATGGVADAQSDAPDRIPASAFPKPDRPVASIVSPIWHDENERDAANEVPQVARLLGIEPGMAVADIGAGSGYYVMRLSPILGPTGRLIAEDITPTYLRSLRAKARSTSGQCHGHNRRTG
jgi:predicted methyltransferase